MLKLLRTEGAFRELAEPNLIAMNGQQASFLAGGEFPVPVLQNFGSGRQWWITIVWKEYGIRLNFKPTIIDEDHIRLELEPEVSTIDFTNGVRFNGFVVPALRTRRAKTGVELRDGQSFALAGLLDNTETKTLSRIPIVSDIPVIGALFKSKSFEKKETELMFFVTAHMVKPVNARRSAEHAWHRWSERQLAFGSRAEGRRHPGPEWLQSLRTERDRLQPPRRPRLKNPKSKPTPTQLNQAPPAQSVACATIKLPCQSPKP